MKRILIYTTILSMLFSCNLDEELVGGRAESNIPDDEKISGNITACQNIMRSMQDTGGYLMIQTHPSDEMAGPTRGADWFDGGVWQQLHLMTWTPTHPRITSAWENLLAGVFYATEILNYNPTPEQEAVGYFYQSFYFFLLNDLFGQVPYRNPGEDLGNLPNVHPRNVAVVTAINQLEQRMQNLPTDSDPTMVNQYNAAALLAKMYLNKAVYAATDDSGMPMTDFTFDPADMQKVIDYCDMVIAGPFSLQSSYFDIFSPENTDVGTEAIMSSPNSHTAGGDIRQNYFMTMHYNQDPSGWNGFVALTDLYNRFDAADPRLSQDIPGLTDVSGLKAGILIGQQYNAAGEEILDRQGNPLIFTQDFSIGNSTEEKGMRAIKYYPDYVDVNRPANDFILIRLADVYLMKAEAMARMGQDPSAVMQELWDARGVTAYSYTGLESILDERSRELYWEGWRRQDQIRFGTFLDPVQERPDVQPASKMIFPIPANPLAANPNLHQNPGY